MSPILVRPVREQLEHDRVIRLLQGRFRRRFEVGINPGHEQNAAVGSGTSVAYPDVVLTSHDGGRRLHGVIEVETTESVNHLEALSQWARLARLRAPFHLYVPTATVDAARRLCADHRINVAEVVTYHSIGDQVRFTTVYRAPASAAKARGRGARAATRRPAARKTAARPAGKVKARAKAAASTRRRKPKSAGKKPKTSRKSVRKTSRSLKRK